MLPDMEQFPADPRDTAGRPRHGGRTPPRRAASAPSHALYVSTHGRSGSPSWILLSMAGLLVVVAGVGSAIVVTRSDSRPTGHITVPAPAVQSPASAGPTGSTVPCQYLPATDIPA